MTAPRAAPVRRDFAPPEPHPPVVPRSLDGAYIVLAISPFPGGGAYTATLVATGPTVDGTPITVRTIDHLHQLRNLQRDWRCDDVRGDVLASLADPTTRPT